VYPTASLAPIVYAVNPTRTLNLDNQVLTHPLVDATLTRGSTRVTRFDRQIEDVIVAERWEGSGRRAAMTTAQLRLLYQYLVNEPVFDPLTPAYVTWEPRDRTAKVYQVELMRLTVGGGATGQEFDVIDLKSRGGKFDGGTFQAAFDGLDVVETGVVDQPVVLTMRVVAEVP